MLALWWGTAKVHPRYPSANQSRTVPRDAFISSCDFNLASPFVDVVVWIFSCMPTWLSNHGLKTPGTFETSSAPVSNLPGTGQWSCLKLPCRLQLKGQRFAKREISLPDDVSPTWIQRGPAATKILQANDLVLQPGSRSTRRLCWVIANGVVKEPGLYAPWQLAASYFCFIVSFLIG